ncbi:MAG: hypothetical protein U1F81_06775 [Verrucomicrobiaceae bacterium]
MDNAIEWVSWILAFASPVVVFAFAAFAWQKHSQPGFLLLALSSMLTVLMVFGNAIMSRYTLTDEEHLAWWRCHATLLIIDGILYPCSLWMVLRHFTDLRPAQRAVIPSDGDSA